MKVVHARSGPCFVSFQAREFRAGALQPGACEVESFVPQLQPAQIRSRPGEAFRAAEQTVNLTAAELIVSAGLVLIRTKMRRFSK